MSCGSFYLPNYNQCETPYSIRSELLQFCPKPHSEEIERRVVASIEIKKNWDQIYNRTDFKHVKVGDFAFFKGVIRLSRVAISKMQELFQSGSKMFSNLTHVGVVTRVEEEEIHVLEIAGRGHPIEENIYNLRELFREEEIFTVSTFESFPQNIQAIRNEWVTQDGDLDLYNTLGIVNLPFHKEIFREENKRDLLNAWIDYAHGKGSPHLVRQGDLQRKNYFCSELAVHIYQFSAFLEELSPLRKQLEEKIKHLDPNQIEHRDRAISILYDETVKWGIWTRLSFNPYFSAPPQFFSPSSLIELVHKYAPVYRVHNLNKDFFEEIPPQTQKEIIERVQYFFAKLLARSLNGEALSLEDKDIQKFLLALEPVSFNPDVFNCISSRCVSDSRPSECVEECLEKFLKLSEKLHIFLISRQIKRGILEVLPSLNQPQQQIFKQILMGNSLSISKEIFSLDSVLDKAYPYSWTRPLDSVENFFTRFAIDTFSWEYEATFLYLCSYVPIAIAYDFPKEEIEEALKKNGLFFPVL